MIETLRRRSPLLIPLACASLLVACAPVAPGLPPSLPLPVSAQSNTASGNEMSRRNDLTVNALPQPPVAQPSNFARGREAADQQRAAAQATAGEVATINLQQVPLPVFIQIVYAEILKRNVNIDPAVQARKELVTFRTGAPQPPEQLDNAVKLLLKSYGVAAIDAGGLLRVVPDNAQLGNLPELRRGAASPDTPLPLRPVFQLVELQVVRQTDVANWLKTLFGTRVNVQEDVGRNALLLSGTPDNLQSALEALRVLDQPLMSGRKSIALAPAYWSADDLARRLAEVMTAQGYAVAPVGQLNQGGIRYPIVLMPVSAVNQVFVFAASDEVLQHVTNWARTLDKPNERGIGKNYFTYQVKHKDAADLAKTLDQLLSGGRVRTATTTPPAAANAAPTGGSATSVVVDQSSNMLIFQADADQYTQIGSLLQTLDRPAKAALIEVTVAELALGDNAQLGVEWLATHAMSNGAQIVGGTLGGLSIGSGGMTFRVFDTVGQIRAVINALASTNQATILSSPRVQARNGETATIQVGQEVPIITSQQTTTGSVTLPTQSAVLQTIQYRNTGVILKVKPVIHSGDQVDLEVQQEVSAAASTNTGVNNSPTFSTRKLETKLTLKNGSTVLMGGLISNDSTQGNAGIPLLKDIPGIGALFSNKTKAENRRELVVLITPYILNDSHDAESLTDAFRKMLGPWAQTARPAALDVQKPQDATGLYPPLGMEPAAPVPAGAASQPGK
ncbi:secretin N-terminal domain-containing protein [Roseateles violae]|uniref:Secretin N-terminal domain-containing protein n=1 Tax=Roseateles violae TaxID=3058042 RepID=A0ABT8DRJ8_9BURK|nr:secretin N-terminal domain-containing protein [Pelomonas sp. PFR6]MDN3920965.1 secretin N-terminal domain-containing protein [Pelomonas sp. PFR6]